jgi:transposase/transposase-like protein
MRVAARLAVQDDDRATLKSWTRSTGIKAGLAQRARIVLLAGDGVPNAEIALRLGVSRPTVRQWRLRYQAGGLGGLEDEARSGRPARIDPLDIVIATLAAPPKRLGLTHWSTRLLAHELGVSNATVANVWADYELQPWRTQTFKFSTDPELDAKVRDIVGLYLHPPEEAVVVCVDEKSQIQALDRTAPILPMRPGLAEKRTHDYVRHGTTTLFAALEVATGKVLDACHPRHRHDEFLSFLKQVAKAWPRRELHVVLDNYGTHKHPAVRAWLNKNPRIHLHFTPTSGSWLNMVEIFFGIITRQAIRRGTFTSVKDLIAAIRRFIDGWNERCEPFIWTKPADEILAKAKRQTIS